MAAMTTKLEASPLVAVEASLRQLFRWGNLPRLRERLTSRAGVQLDKASNSLIAPLEQGSLRVSEIAQRSGVDISTASRQIVELERAGVVRRKSDVADARASILDLTPLGRRHLKKLAVARQAMLGEILEDFSNEDLSQLARLLERLNGNIAAYLEDR
jgi:DNA-binding MarR family transcriptional regulator